MEASSLLSEALSFMQRTRNDERSVIASLFHCVPFKYEPFDFMEAKEVMMNDPTSGHAGVNHNILVFNIFLMDSTMRTIKDVHKGLCHVYKIIQKELFPRYRNLYQHLWLVGGTGLYEGFGLHYHNKPQEEDVLHLRGNVYYGPNPHPDEWFSIALAFQISKDLYTLYGITVAIECWDADDGQIILIESAADVRYDCSFPAWIDQMGNVDRMKRRVYIVDGQIHLIHFMDQEIKSLSRSKALTSLHRNIALGQSTIIQGVSLRKRIQPFLHLLSLPSGESIPSSPSVHEWLHTAALTLPQSLAQLIVRRPDLVPCAILAFCEMSPYKLGYRKTHTSQSSMGQIYLPFENLVLTKMTLSKTLYAILLTAAGEIPPPIRVPPSYRTVESNRMRRQCSIKDQSLFRHAFECGVRLSLGFEWLLSTKHTASINAKSVTVETRILKDHVRANIVAGGDGQWIQRAWKEGPACCDVEDDISDLVLCPIFQSEIMCGGICPLTYPSQSVQNQVQTILRDIESSFDESQLMPPVPLIHELDSDNWIDEWPLSGNDVENLGSQHIVPDEESVIKLDAVQEMDFSPNKSDGAHEVDVPILKSSYVDLKNMKDDDDICIDAKLFLTVLYDALKPQDQSNDNSKDDSLLQYFAVDDLTWST